MNLLAVGLWGAVLTSSVLLVRGLRRARPAPAGPAPALQDLSEAAFLAGGPGAVVDAALVSLLWDGRLLVGGPGIVHVRPGARAADPAEHAVLRAHAGAPSGWLYQVRYAAMLDPAVQGTGDALAARGLLSPPGWGRTWRRWAIVQAVVCAVLVPLSLPLTFIEFLLEPGSRVPFVVTVLPALLAGALVGGLCAARAATRLTPAGTRALCAIRAAYINDPAPHVQTALLGLRGLRDPYLREQLVPAVRGTRLAAARPRSSASSAGVAPAVWCAGSDAGSGSGCGSSGSSCSGGSSGGGCGSSGSSGSSCGSSSSGSSCSSSS
ncbi:TIGR04222 domain-containing membrane protein [Streptomyces sp. NPDC002990]